MAVSEHTPTPWQTKEGHSVVSILSDTGIRIATTDGTPYYKSVGELDKANAAFIVKAVNSHDDLVAALQALRMTEESIVSSQGNTITLRIPLAAIQQAAAALRKAEATE